MINEVGTPRILTVTGVVDGNGSGKLLGFFVASGTPTLKLWDNATAGSGTVLLNSTILRAIEWFPFPIAYTNGLYATMTNAGSIAFVIGKV